MRQTQVNSTAQRRRGRLRGSSFHLPSALPDAGNLTAGRSEFSRVKFWRHLGFGVLQETGAQSSFNREVLNVPTPTASDADRPPGLNWDFTRGGIAKAVASIGIFAALYLVLVLLGLRLHENAERLTIIWPAAGLLFMALWLAPVRNWIWILAIQLTIELTAGAALRAHFQLATYSVYALAN